MTRYCIKLQYFGKNYCGSQKQAGETDAQQPNTIQQEVEKALSTLIKQKISTVFSGRTDAGVSALGQTVHFDTEGELDIEKFRYSLDSILPDDIVASEIFKVGDDFHAQMSAKYRHYQYKIRSCKSPSPFDVNVFHTRQELDVNRLNEALSHLVGEHDFSAFKSTSDNPAKVCKIYKTAAQKESRPEGDYIIIDIVGNRFLYNMVRTIVGTLLMIEKDGLAPLTMAQILNSKDRAQAGATASPIGLTLIEAGYKEYKQ